MERARHVGRRNDDGERGILTATFRAAPRLEGFRLLPFGSDARLDFGRLKCLFEHGVRFRLSDRG